MKSTKGDATNKEPKDSRDLGIIQKKDRDGNIVYYARIVRADGTGRPKQYTRRAENKSQARRLIKDLKEEYDSAGERGIDGDRLVFRVLAAEYKKRKLIPTQYHGEGEGQRKVAGLRSWKTPQGFLDTLIKYFGARRIRDITHDDIEQFKLLRLNNVTVRGKPRTIASVNRELELMRAVMRFASRQGWIMRSPFESGAPVISKSDERRRERVLTDDEETRLLAACTGRRAHLKSLLIAALNTGMRRGELFKLQWSYVSGGTITVRAMNSKTARPRIVPMTSRVAQELETLRASAPPDSNGLVFGITDTVKKSFAAACKAAGIDGFRLHDCRHTAITRMIAAGIPSSEVMKISGLRRWARFCVT